MVSDYRPEWSAQAATKIDALREKCGAAAVRIEHIGSTAIPTMPAKDVLDLQVSVHDLDLAARAFDGPLHALGYRRSPYEVDHVPAGRSDDPARWAKRLWLLRAGESPDVNLHMRKVGSPNERLALLFRDWFRAHPEAIPAYGRFKQSLAGAVDSIDNYVEVKDPIVDLVAIVAESWAADSGWRP